MATLLSKFPWRSERIRKINEARQEQEAPGHERPDHVRPIPVRQADGLPAAKAPPAAPTRDAPARRPPEHPAPALNVNPAAMTTSGDPADRLAPTRETAARRTAARRIAARRVPGSRRVREQSANRTPAGAKNQPTGIVRTKVPPNGGSATIAARRIAARPLRGRPAWRTTDRPASLQLVGNQIPQKIARRADPPDPDRRLTGPGPFRVARREIARLSVTTDDPLTNVVPPNVVRSGRVRPGREPGTSASRPPEAGTSGVPTRIQNPSGRRITTASIGSRKRLPRKFKRKSRPASPSPARYA